MKLILFSSKLSSFFLFTFFPCGFPFKLLQNVAERKRDVQQLELRIGQKQEKREKQDCRKMQKRAKKMKDLFAIMYGSVYKVVANTKRKL